MNDKSEEILKSVNDALGIHTSLFDIEKSEILVEEENYFSATVMFSPRGNESLAHHDCVVAAEIQYLQFDVADNEVNLMSGEDCEYGLEVTFGSIYSQLYWGEVIHAI